jgi:CBS domain containing-hemolysin-like protein
MALRVDELMRPIREAAVLSAADSLAENLEVMTNRRFSRYPYLNAEGRALGMIHLKELFLAQQQGPAVTDLGDYLRPIQQVSPELPAAELLRRIRGGAPHFALVGGKDQPPLGFLTLDNLLGALVGEIRDEFRQGTDWVRMDDGSYFGAGSLPVFTLERTLGIDIEREAATTVSGLVMERLGSVPREGQRIVLEGFDLVIKRMKGPRILLVRAYPQ